MKASQEVVERARKLADDVVTALNEAGMLRVDNGPWRVISGSLPDFPHLYCVWGNGKARAWFVWESDATAYANILNGGTA